MSELATNDCLLKGSTNFSVPRIGAQSGSLVTPSRCNQTGDFPGQEKVVSSMTGPMRTFFTNGVAHVQPLPNTMFGRPETSPGTGPGTGLGTGPRTGSEIATGPSPAPSTASQPQSAPTCL